MWGLKKNSTACPAQNISHSCAHWFFTLPIVNKSWQGCTKRTIFANLKNFQNSFQLSDYKFLSNDEVYYHRQVRIISWRSWCKPWILYGAQWSYRKTIPFSKIVKWVYKRDAILQSKARPFARWWYNWKRGHFGFIKYLSYLILNCSKMIWGWESLHFFDGLR